MNLTPQQIRQKEWYEVVENIAPRNLGLNYCNLSGCRNRRWRADETIFSSRVRWELLKPNKQKQKTKLWH
ncbi:MAG TPA: hypothetical protein VFV23_05615 [Verrucomicrobiae bacterium]|nr:hypothetical protein [Verrucomicrobiae bacterium]